MFFVFQEIKNDNEKNSVLKISQESKMEKFSNLS